jgi:DnaK suppressor protein
MSADLAVGTPVVHLTPQARHLTADALPRWRTLLELHWRARLERVTELSLAYHDAQEATPAQARTVLRQAVAERRALAEIEAALSRLTSGRFGSCERCGDPVSATRLTRTPQVRYCDTCDH